jgi:zinc-finger of transposase IS204/IS1001/IS1096/IS1165
VHSRYERRVADAAVAGRRVVIRLRVRRFVCRTNGCPVTTFAEQVEGLTTRYGRRTVLLAEMVTAIGVALAGRAGSRLAARLGLATGRNAVLRLVRGLPDPEIGAVPVLGVDLSRLWGYSDKVGGRWWAACSGRASRLGWWMGVRDNYRLSRKASSLSLGR